MRSGKLSVAVLEELLALSGAPDPAVVLGPAIGEDAAAVDMGDQYLILKSDPVTFTSDEIGWYAVHINANDVSTRGARPRWFQAVILLPAGSGEILARDIFKQVHEAALELGVAVAGGHTEVTNAVRQPIVVGSMQGIVPKGRLVTTGGARVGDALLMTKSAGIEGTAIIGREKRDELMLHFDSDLVQQAANFLRTPGISVVEEALVAAEAGATALHDPTEGGVAMGLWEISKACGHTLEVEASAIPVADETRAISKFYELNPLGLTSSGTLLVSIHEQRTDQLLRAYQRMDIRATCIGRVGPPGLGLSEVGDQGEYALVPSEQDEITKVLAG